MLMGQYKLTVDQKKRITIPSKFRYELGEFTVLICLSKCLELYSLKDFEKITQTISDDLNSIASVIRLHKYITRFIRLFLSWACYCEADIRGRISIPLKLAAHANISRDVLCIGVGNHLEIWDVESYNKET